MAVVELEYPDDEYCGMAVVGILGDECRGEGKTTLHKGCATGSSRGAARIAAYAWRFC